MGSSSSHDLMCKHEDHEHNHEIEKLSKKMMKEYLNLPAQERKPKELMDKVPTPSPDMHDQVHTIVHYSKTLTSKSLFNDAHTLILSANYKYQNELELLQEASRVCFVMKEYATTIDYCKKCAKLEKGMNAETFSDISRCFFEEYRVAIEAEQEAPGDKL